MTGAVCKACGRPLKDVDSARTGVGPVCAGRGPLPRDPAALFRSVVFTDTVRGVLIVFDSGAGSLRAEHDLDGILADLDPHTPEQILLRSLDQRYALVRHRNRVLGGIEWLPTRDLSGALTIIKGRERIAA